MLIAGHISDQKVHTEEPSFPLVEKPCLLCLLIDRKMSEFKFNWIFCLIPRLEGKVVWRRKAGSCCWQYCNRLSRSKLFVHEYVRAYLLLEDEPPMIEAIIATPLCLIVSTGQAGGTCYTLVVSGFWRQASYVWYSKRRNLVLKTWDRDGGENTIHKQYLTTLVLQHLLCIGSREYVHAVGNWGHVAVTGERLDVHMKHGK